jgi:hypothetical protein
LSPTIFQYKHYRFFFFSREEARMHVHVHTPDGEAKFWIEPRIELAINKGIKQADINAIHRKIEEKIDEIKKAWETHFER